MTVAIIGCGGTGAAIAAQLVKKNKLNRLKLADFCLARVEKLLPELYKINKKLDCQYFQIDAKKDKDIESILKDVEVVINAASPFCNIPIMKACLKSGSNYIDLASDPFIYPDIKEKTAIDYQLELHDVFVEKDLVAITNAGASPGFSDLLCKHAIEENSLDSLQHVKIYFVEIIKSDRLVTSWSPYFLLLESILPATVYKNNEIIEIESHQRQKLISFPSQIGQVKITLFNGHPELRTIPEFIDIPIDYIEVGGNILFNKMQLDDLILNALRKRVKDSIIFKGDIFEILSTSFESSDKFIDYYKDGIITKNLLSCLIEVVGKKNNISSKYSATATLDLEKVYKNIPVATASSFMVSVVPTILTEKIIKGEIIEKGVTGPAALSMASDIIEKSKKFDINFKEFIE